LLPSAQVKNAIRNFNLLSPGRVPAWIYRVRAICTAVSEKRTGSKWKIPQPFGDVVIACVLVGSVFLVMFTYTGSWPPLVVVESRSMQHSETESEIGVMDTGDLTMVKKVSSVGDIRTYVSSLQDGYKTYGDYGDVVIYYKGGDQSKTPIIHRAVIYLTSNGNGSLSAPELAGLVRGIDYDLDLPNNTASYITDDIRLHSYGYRGLEVVVPVASILSYMHTHGIPVHGGFVTKGDLNPIVDQSMFMDAREPVSFEWVHGVATGEIPWFGILKLFMTGTLPEDTPANSYLYLWVCIGAIVAIPVGGEAYAWWREGKSKKPPETTPAAVAEEKPAPGKPEETPVAVVPEEKKL
jgi:signal peptidase